MLAARRIAELRQLTRQLQRVGRDIDAAAGGARPRSLGGDGAAVVLTRGAAAAPPRVRSLRGLQEKILFRRAPIVVSLVERSLVALERRTDSRSAARQTHHHHQHQQLEEGALSAEALAADLGSGSGRGAAAEGPETRLVRLPQRTAAAPLPTDAAHLARHAALAAETLRLLCTLEEERRALLADKQRAAQAQVRRLQRQVEEARTAGVPVEVLRGRLRDAQLDERLLMQSLLARPLLSARMWRLLLAERIWLGAIAAAAAAGEQPRDGSSAGLGGQDRFLLFYMCHLLARLVLGTVKDYVGGSDVSRRAPRFVASLPSAAFLSGAGKPAEVPQRDTAADSGDAAGTEGAEEDTDDVLALMLSGAAAAGGATPPAPHQRREDRPSPAAVSLRWVPPHAADVHPLLVETLALFSFVVPELDCAAIAQAGLVAELAGLLAALQKIATTALLLQPPASPGAATDAPLHEALRRLEGGMLTAGETMMRACGEALQSDATAAGNRGRGAADAVFGGLTAPRAVALIAELNSLRLFDGAGSDAGRRRAVLEALVLRVFPQLTTNTQRTLTAKARASSLLAFATKAHRGKLYSQHGGRQGAEQFVLGTVIQRARLEQRRMAAALREQHLSSAHLQSITALAAAVSPLDTAAVLRLLATTTASTAAAPSPVAEAQQGRLVTAALFTAETFLVSGAVREAIDGTAAAPAESLTTHDLAQLWSALALLWPVVDARRDRARHQQQQQKGHSRGTASDAGTETAILAFATESVLAALNSCVAQRLSALAGDSDVSDGAALAITAEHIATVALGLIAWHEVDPSTRRHRPASLAQEVATTEKLLREVVLQDTAVWQEVRGWPAAKRAAFESRMLECLAAAKLLDSASTLAVQRACSTVL